jgi:peptidyl-prolyl cis-trans isomerase A (cyclophilin A)
MLRHAGVILLSFTLVAGGQTKGKAAGHTGKPKTAAKAPATPPPPPTAILHTTAGDMKCELFPDKAPKTVANFIGLATGQKDWTDPKTGKVEHNHPFYDGVIFHRVIPNFMIQGGDPTGTGSGGPGYEMEDELLPDLLFDQPGRLAMANHGPNTQGSQFFITEIPQPGLNPCLDDAGCAKPYGRVPKGTGYTIFGQCDAATIELVKKIARMPCAGGAACDGRNSHPQNPVKIEHVEIQNAPKAATAKPARRKSSARKKAKT